jgi:hypothetical protein
MSFRCLVKASQRAKLPNSAALAILRFRDYARNVCPEKLSPQDKRACVRAVTSGRLDTATAAAKQLREETSVEVSDFTVRRALREAGLMAQEKEAKPKLSAKNIKARLDFARRHRYWTVEDWKRVIWSDETKVNRFSSDGRSWCWARDGEGRQPRHVKQTLGLYDCPRPRIHLQD